jgi:hypothetical protein
MFYMAHPLEALIDQILVASARLKDLSDPVKCREEMLVLAELQIKLAMEMEAFRKYG